MWGTIKIKTDVLIRFQQNEILTGKIYHRVKIEISDL
jgi:hypothetical protein